MPAQAESNHHPVFRFRLALRCWVQELRRAERDHRCFFHPGTGLVDYLVLKLSKFRCWLYRRGFLLRKANFAEFFKIYKMDTLLHCSNLKVAVLRITSQNFGEFPGCLENSAEFSRQSVMFFNNISFYIGMNGTTRTSCALPKPRARPRPPRRMEKGQFGCWVA